MAAGAERAFAPVQRELLPGADKNVLRQLLCVRPVGDHSRTDGEDPIDVGPVESLECLTVTRRGHRHVGRVTRNSKRLAFQFCHRHPLPVRVSLLAE
jgi:hypothetical protein